MASSFSVSDSKAFPDLLGSPTLGVLEVLPPVLFPNPEIPTLGDSFLQVLLDLMEEEKVWAPHVFCSSLLRSAREVRLGNGL